MGSVTDSSLTNMLGGRLGLGSHISTTLACKRLVTNLLIYFVYEYIFNKWV